MNRNLKKHVANTLAWVVGLSVWSGCDRGMHKPAPQPKQTPIVSEAVQRRNAELLREMMSVVLGEKVFLQTLDRGVFGDWVDSLNQGMSLEGAYRGIVYGERYRGLEASSMASSDACRQKFAELRTELGDEKVSGVSGKGYGPHGLKRILGEWALGQIERPDFQGDARALARWFSAWAIKMNQHGVLFGVALRREATAEFHERWVVDMIARGERDRVLWEVLTRLHRVMNAACGL